jgi:hypothetical protein
MNLCGGGVTGPPKYLCSAVQDTRWKPGVPVKARYKALALDDPKKRGITTVNEGVHVFLTRNGAKDSSWGDVIVPVTVQIDELIGVSKREDVAAFHSATISKRNYTIALRGR